MCGIAGIFNLDSSPVDPSIIKGMNKTLSHRGPDDEGLFIDNNIGLGHRRLSIIDLSPEGHQPMSNEDGSLWIVHNGEIYNYIELMEELKSLGHVFRSKSDTEVILHAFEEWHDGCLGRFNGMWAFAIWDKNKKELFCSRDRFGVKPFYYFFNKNKFVFSSEIKAIFENKDIPKNPNRKAIYRYLVKGYGYVDTNDETFFEDIRQLPPAHFMRISKDMFKYKRYWVLDALRKDYSISLEGAGEKVASLLTDSVRLRLRSDVSVGISLSGGIDSSVLAIIMSGLSDKNIESFSACFDEEGFDERRYINKTLEDKKIIPNFVFPRADSLVRDFEKIIWHQDEPYSGASVFSQWKVMEEAKRKGVKVLITGQGGDEIFSGYNKYYPYYFADLFSGLKISKLCKELSMLDESNTFSKKDAFFAAMKIIGSDIYSKTLKNILGPSPVARPAFLDKDFFEENMFLRNEYADGFSSYLDRELYNSLTVSPLPSLLHIDDRNSMAHSVESRPPFLDYRLAEFSFTLPYHMKISGGVTKHVLREAFRGRLPEEIRSRRDKMGFVTPVGEWFKGELKDYMYGIVSSADFEKRGIFDRQGVRAVLQSNLRGEKDFNFTIWSWVNLELWFNRFFN